MRGLSVEAVTVLREAQATATTVVLPDRPLDRNVYAEVNKALTRIGGGGKWNRQRQVHVFPGDPREELAALTGSGIMPADPDAAMGYFRTPAGVALRAVTPILDHRQRHVWAGGDDYRVLEPSAGDGALADVLLAHLGSASSLTTIEPDPDRRAQLTAKGYDPVEGTFEEYAAARGRLLAGGVTFPPFDAVLMNPPFATAGHPALWAEHLLLAWELLAPGGIISAIMPNVPLTPGHRRYGPIGDLVAASGTVQRLPVGAFRESGTSVSTCLIVLLKPAEGASPR